MARALNTKLVETAKPDPARRIEIADGAVSGLYFIIQPSGSKSWAVRYRNAGRPAKLTLGPYPRLPLAEAREAARETLRIVSEGQDPSGRQNYPRPAQAPAEACGRPHLREGAGAFHRGAGAQGPALGRRDRRILEKDALPRWKGRPVDSITAADVVEAVEAIVERGSPVAASRFRAWCSKFFAYAVAAQLRPDNPVRGIEDPISQKSIQRDRKLVDRELVLVWRAAEALGYPFGPAVQLLILTGQRRAEVLEATWDEFDQKARTWTIPRERAKNDREHHVPLSRAAIAIVESLPRIAGSPFLFSTTGTTPVSRREQS